MSAATGIKLKRLEFAVDDLWAGRLVLDVLRKSLNTGRRHDIRPLQSDHATAEHRFLDNNFRHVA